MEDYRADGMLLRHELKCWPEFFAHLIDGTKTFEIRYNDRDYRKGDCLWIREWSAESGYTGREKRFVVTYILRQSPGLLSGYVVLSLTALEGG